jgi:TRAP-type C4-dicarboxylate transport system substrate-binding protein
MKFLPLQLLVTILFLVAVTECSFAQQYTIKFATLAPEGSTWMNVMKEYDAAIRKESGGKLGFKIYANGVQGDEKDVLRKIKLGQLQSAGITGVGIGEIAPEVRILDSPFLFKSSEEADYIYKTFGQDFDAAFQKGGYVNLGWAEVGFVYVFTNTPVKQPADMSSVKMWLWEGDPVAEASLKVLGIHAIPLSIADVLTSLQTGLVDGFYTTPFAAVALQWFTRAKYVFDAPLSNACGAVVISKKKYDELPPDLQEILSRNGNIYLSKLTTAVREDNIKSMTTLKQQGITIVEPASNQVKGQLDEIGKQTRQALVGKLFDQALLTRVENALKSYREAGAKGSK